VLAGAGAGTGALAAVSGGAATGASASAPGLAPTLAGSGPRRPAVVGHRVIGHTVTGRAIHAWRLGERTARRRVVVLAALHGTETAPRRILRSLRDGRPRRGLDLWLVPTVNPDGVARGTRQNAHGVDQNRNFPREWARLDGTVESGPEPASEPETRALMRFLRRVDPRFVVSFHQPLHGVDVHGPKQRWFARRLSRELHLPRTDFACGSRGCHGTLTQWFNHNFDGVAVTVEYGEHPSAERMTARAPRQLLRALRPR
jgi:predicted deacylase